MVASHVPPTGDWACNPGMCPAGNRTSDPLLCSPALLVLFDSHLKANIPNPVPSIPPKVVFSVESSAILPAAQAKIRGNTFDVSLTSLIHSGNCGGLNSVAQSSCLPRTSERDLIWDLCRCH